MKKIYIYILCTKNVIKKFLNLESNGVLIKLNKNIVQ